MPVTGRRMRASETANTLSESPQQERSGECAPQQEGRLAHQDRRFMRMAWKGGKPDEFGLRAGAHVRSIDQRIWSLRISGLCLKWAAFPAWGAVTVLMVRRTLYTGSFWSLSGLGLVACSLASGALLLWGRQALRREVEQLESERFELL